MRIPALLASLCLSCASSPPAGPRTADSPAAARVTRCEVVMQSRKSGYSTARFRTDGTIDFDFRYLENGRGTTLQARARLAGDGTLLAYDAHGTNARGMPIQETFRVEGGRASWKSREESGEQALTGPAFYVPMGSSPELVGLLFAALRRHGGELPLLPGGVARLEREETIAVKSAAGREKTLVTWAITGYDLEPTRIFAEADGTYFGAVDEWFSCLPEGWSPAIEPLLALQSSLDEKRERAIAARLAAVPPAAGVAITHARVLDSERRRWLPDHTILVVDGRIAALGPSAKVAVPDGARVVDAAGRAVLPGLWDMHTHNHDDDGRLDIAAGITTARDLGNDPDLLDRLRRRWDSGEAIGPRVLRSGFIEGRGENAASSKITAETEEEARAAVEFYAARGYEGIKIYNSVKPALVPLIARLAHDRGMRVSGHIPAGMTAEDAVRAGYDEIQHLNMVFLRFLADEKTDTRTHQRVTVVADRAADLDLSSPEVEAFIRLLREKKTVIDPTLYVFELLFVSRTGQILPAFRELVARLPVQAQRGYRGGGLPVPPGKDETFRRSFAAMLAMLKKLHDAGVPIVAGTDAPGGLTMHRELELYVEAGLSPAEAIETATLGAARVVKRDRTSGSIAVGKDADLILVDGDPLADIRDLRKVVTTMKGGVLYSVADIYRTLGIRP